MAGSGWMLYMVGSHFAASVGGKEPGLERLARGYLKSVQPDARFDRVTHEAVLISPGETVWEILVVESRVDEEHVVLLGSVHPHCAELAREGLAVVREAVHPVRFSGRQSIGGGGGYRSKGPGVCVDLSLLFQF